MIHNEHQNRAESHRDMQLVVSGENMRRDQRDKYRSKRAAKRGHQIKSCQVRMHRFQSREFAMAEHARDEKPETVKRNQNLKRKPAERRRERVRHRAERYAEQSQK